MFPPKRCLKHLQFRSLFPDPASCVLNDTIFLLTELRGGVIALHCLGLGHLTALKPEKLQNHPQVHQDGEESLNMLPHAAAGWGRQGRALQDRDSRCARLPQTDCQISEYKHILNPLRKRAAQLSVLTLFSNVAQQDTMFLQVVFNPVAWLKGYAVPQKLYVLWTAKLKAGLCAEAGTR